VGYSTATGANFFKMTWVVGANTAFGYGMIVSDTCVTFPDGREMDLVQKSYPIAPDMIAGFSGNIKNGFIHIGLMQRFLHVHEEELAHDPEMIAEQFSEKARIASENIPGYVTDAASSILLVGIHPQKRNAFGYPMSIGAIFRSPDFTPTIYRDLNDLFSIGSGNDVEKYMGTLEDIQKDWAKFINMGPSNYGTVIMLAGSQNRPPPGTSK
jgi:hypothetical protein